MRRLTWACIELLCRKGPGELPFNAHGIYDLGRPGGSTKAEYVYKYSFGPSPIMSFQTQIPPSLPGILQVCL